MSSRRTGQSLGAATGMVFEIEEFAVHDGPGIRTTVFFKGCPLRCAWCHNPESISFAPEVMLDRCPCASCPGDVDIRSGFCPSCGKAVDQCSLRLRRVSGTAYAVDELAGILLVNMDMLQGSGGGITLSGGEPLAQSAFLTQLIPALRPLHVAIETSGQASRGVFDRAVRLVDLVMMDVKHSDTKVHRRFTGVGNEKILQNLQSLCRGNTPFVIRVPLIPGVNDTNENMEQTAVLLAGAQSLQRVELLPYNTMAPAKYARLGQSYQPGFDPSRRPKVHLGPFERRGIPCEVL